MPVHRASRLTTRASANAEPFGPGEFGPMSSAAGSTVSPDTAFADVLDLDPNSPRQTASV
jgi:hypothetical protein